MAKLKIKMAGEFALVVNCRLCVLTTIHVGRLEWAGRLVRMSDERTVKIVCLGETRRKKHSRKTKIKVVRLN